MVIKKALSCFIFLFLIFSTLPLQAAFVKSYFAYVYESPQVQSEIKLRLTRGQSVEEVEKSGNWVKIKVEEQTGWIHRLSLSDQAILSKISISKTPIVKRSKRRRNPRLRTARAAVGVKGLRESQANRIKEDAGNFEAVTEMETYVVSEETAMQFIVEYQE